MLDRARWRSVGIRIYDSNDNTRSMVDNRHFHVSGPPNMPMGPPPPRGYVPSSLVHQAPVTAGAQFMPNQFSGVQQLPQGPPAHQRLPMPNGVPHPAPQHIVPSQSNSLALQHLQPNVPGQFNIPRLPPGHHHPAVLASMNVQAYPQARSTNMAMHRL
jgi:hypothetical protein